LSEPKKAKLVSQDPELNGQRVIVVEPHGEASALCVLEDMPGVIFYWPLAQMETVEAAKP
jgi:hypothetical protein